MRFTIPLVFVLCLRECFICVWLSACESVRPVRPGAGELVLKICAQRVRSVCTMCNVSIM